MESGWLVALVGFMGTVIGACIQAFAPTIIRKVSRPNNMESVNGNWRGEWKTTFPPNKEDSIEDSIELAQTRDGMITGAGNVPSVGKYLISGKESHYCIVLTFNGTESKKELAGVVLLKKLPGADRLFGHWIQLDHDGELVGGEVTLYKNKP